MGARLALFRRSIYYHLPDFIVTKQPRKRISKKEIGIANGTDTIARYRAASPGHRLIGTSIAYKIVKTPTPPP